MDNFKKVLVVDDEVAIRQICQRVLEKFGYEVSTAGDGQEALQKVKAKEFDLLMTDLSMPEVNGMELIKSALPISPNIKVIVMTGNAEFDESQLEAIGLHSFGILQKPFMIVDLQEKIKKLMI